LSGWAPAWAHVSESLALPAGTPEPVARMSAQVRPVAILGYAIGQNSVTQTGTLRLRDYGDWVGARRRRAEDFQSRVRSVGPSAHMSSPDNTLAVIPIDAISVVAGARNHRNRLASPLRWTSEADT
jgi:hypothetical protein